MRFLIFYKSIVQVGGAENFLFEFSRSLVKKHKIQIICFDFKDSVLNNYDDLRPFVNQIQSNSIKKIFDLGKEAKKYDYVLIHSGMKDFYISNLFYKSKYLIFLHHPFFHSLDYFDVLSIFHKKSKKKLESDPVFIDFKKNLLKKKGSSNFFKINILALINILAIKKAYKTIVLSLYSKAEKNEYFNIQSTYLPPAVSSYYLGSSIKFEKSEKYVLYFGRLTKEKRVDLVIKSFEKSGLQNFKLLIIGVGEDEERLKKIAENCEKEIKFLGFVSTEKLIEYISHASFTITLEWADYNLTVYESIALGTRVIFGKNFEEEPFDLPFIKSKMLFYVKPNIHEVSILMNEVSKLPDVKLEDYNFIRNYNWDWYVDNFLMLFEDE